MRAVSSRGALKGLQGVNRSRGIVGVDDDDRAGPLRDEAPDFLRVGDEVLLRMAGVVHGLARMKDGCRGPERVVGARDEDFVPCFEQRRQAEHNQLGDTVPHEHIVRSDLHHAARLLLHDHRFAGGEDPLLVAVSVGLSEVFNHRQTHRLRGAETEGAGVADVEFDDFVTGFFKFARPLCEGAPDFILNVLEAGTGLDAGWFRKKGRVSSPKKAEPE